MPRCRPSAPDSADGRTAERVVWGALRDQLPEDDMLYVGLSGARTLLVALGQAELFVRVGGGGVRSRLKGTERWTP